MAVDTFSNIKISSHIEPLVLRGQGIPKGFFAVEAAIEGIEITYLLRGKRGAEGAAIVARVEHYEDFMSGNLSARGYRGDRLKGGEVAHDFGGDIEEFFAHIAR